MTRPPHPLGAYGAATLHEAGAAPLPAQLRPLDRRWRLSGPAFTVELKPGNNIWLHRALYAAAPGDVLVASTKGAYDFGYWGDILTRAAIRQRLAGLVIDGAVRDSTDLLELGFPVFARGVCVRGTGKDDTAGGLDRDIAIGLVTVRPGDVLVGDADGVVVVAWEDAAAVAERAQHREVAEARAREEISAGQSTVAIYGF
jgi:4-hydroxy-4-methyl-2-oxoglutarate aldolase